MAKADGHPADGAAQLSPKETSGVPWGQGSDISVRKLQVFWAIAHTGTLTRAAKLLGLTQPSLSQQLAGLEATVGGLLFERRSNALILTDLGVSILSKAEQVLRSLQELEDGLSISGAHLRHQVRIAGTNAAMRLILPEALKLLSAEVGQINTDLYEMSPGEVLDMLYARRVNVGLLAETAVASASSGFQRVAVLEDPYVLVVPRRLDLTDVAKLSELTEDDRELMQSTLQFSFGTQHQNRVQNWYDRAIPHNRTAGRARSFELLVGLVRHGLGVCIAPALSLPLEPGVMDHVRLYSTGLAPRRTVAMFPSHYRHQEPYTRLLELLQEVGARAGEELPAIEKMPPFMDGVAESSEAESAS